MKTVKTFNKESVYSDVEPTRADAIFLKYIGEKGNTAYFLPLGDDGGYAYSYDSTLGRCIGFYDATKCELSGKEVQELIKNGKITL